MPISVTVFHGGIYRLASRNLAVGSYNEHTGGFTGIRSKFGKRFLDVEYHWDHGSELIRRGTGTARPLELIEVRLEFEPVAGWWDYKAPHGFRWTSNDALFEYLDTTYGKEER